MTFKVFRRLGRHANLLASSLIRDIGLGTEESLEQYSYVAQSDTVPRRPRQLGAELDGNCAYRGGGPNAGVRTSGEFALRLLRAGLITAFLPIEQCPDLVAGALARGF